MKLFRPSADASYLTHGAAIADFGRMDSAACYGNLADFSMNAILIQDSVVQENAPTVGDKRRSPEQTPKTAN